MVRYHDTSWYRRLLWVKWSSRGVKEPRILQIGCLLLNSLWPKNRTNAIELPLKLSDSSAYKSWLWSVSKAPLRAGGCSLRVACLSSFGAWLDFREDTIPVESSTPISKLLAQDGAGDVKSHYLPLAAIFQLSARNTTSLSRAATTARS